MKVHRSIKLASWTILVCFALGICLANLIGENVLAGQEQRGLLHPQLHRVADAIVESQHRSLAEIEHEAFEAILFEFAKANHVDVFGALRKQTFD